MILLAVLLYSQTPSGSLASLRSTMRESKIGKYTIYAVEPDTRYLIRMTPERFRYQADVRSTQDDFAKHPDFLRSFADAFDHTRITESKGWEVDVRTGVEIKSRAGTRLIYICTNSDRSLADINGKVFSIHGKLSSWFNNMSRQALKSKR